ncbi:glycosyltransferase family 87 protein [Microvirga sp. P5_D2]
MIVTILEAARSSTPKGSRYTRVILLTLAALLLAKIVWFTGSTQGDGARPLVDFDMFHLVGQMIWRGELHLAYRFETLVNAQRTVTGSDSVMPWTYPPQFNLLIAPLALMPRWLAYGLFTAATLIGYLAVLKRLAGEYLPLVLFTTFPALTITIACGQNGFLTGMLIGLASLGLKRHSSLAGIPLGLMIIMPHLAAACAIYTIVSRRWATVGVAAATIIITSAIATWIFGPKPA